MSVIAQPIHAGCPVTTFPPIVLSVSPQGVIQGGTKTVTLSGSYLSGASVSISGSGITWSVTGSSDSYINLSVTVDPAAVMEQRTIRVSNLYGSTTIGLNILNGAYPGGRFLSNSPVWAGGRFGSAHFGVDRFKYAALYTWQLSKLYVNIGATGQQVGSWGWRAFYRWDVAQNSWLRIETVPALPQMIWGESKWYQSIW